VPTTSLVELLTSVLSVVKLTVEILIIIGDEEAEHTEYEVESSFTGVELDVDVGVLLDGALLICVASVYVLGAGS
jgi:hypothetical protein